MSKHMEISVRVPIEQDNPSIVREEAKCIKCGQCKEVCRNQIGVLGHYDLGLTGDIPICIHCGQCANVCPPGSITEQYEYHEVEKAVQDADKIVIVSTSPSVRAALGEAFGMADGSFVEGRMVALLRALGADYVLDTNFSADLTIMEEGSELIERLTKGEKPLPQFTSCCPAWVKFAETYYPDLLPNISTAKSPIGMQGPTIKTYFAQKMGIDPRKIVNVALTPCTAKKYEIRREEMNAASGHLDIPGMRDMDYVITTREAVLWAKEKGIDFMALPDADFDSLMGKGSGAGVIFGNTGGVMEAALRTAYELAAGETAPELFYNLEPVRGMEGIREASLTIGGNKLNVAVIYGTENARRFIEENGLVKGGAKEGGKQYHFVEVMTCPGGCIGGGGQPKDTEYKGDELRRKRIDSLYARDRGMELRLSHENEEIKQLYEEFYHKPLSGLAEKMLHTMYTDRSADLGENKEEIKTSREAAKAEISNYVCTVCGYVCEGDAPPAECPVCHAGPDIFIRRDNEPVWAAEHAAGAKKGAARDIIEDLRSNYTGECTEVGMYLAMARAACREGYPEIGRYWEKAAWEEAEHAAKFAELLGENLTDSTKKNLQMRVEAENGAAGGKADLARRAKEAGLDAIHDTVHEMARDEARHGKAFEGLLKRYFG